VQTASVLGRNIHYGVAPCEREAAYHRREVAVDTLYDSALPFSINGDTLCLASLTYQARARFHLDCEFVVGTAGHKDCVRNVSRVNTSLDGRRIACAVGGDIPCAGVRRGDQHQAEQAHKAHGCSHAVLAARSGLELWKHMSRAVDFIVPVELHAVNPKRRFESCLSFDPE
jgi:hypothetical protein